MRPFFRVLHELSHSRMTEDAARGFAGFGGEFKKLNRLSVVIMNQFAIVIALVLALARSSPCGIITCCVINASFDGSRYVARYPVVLGVVVKPMITLESIFADTPARVWMDLHGAYFPADPINVLRGNITLIRRGNGDPGCITGQITWGTKVVYINSQLETIDGLVFGWLRADMYCGDWTNGPCASTPVPYPTDAPVPAPNAPVDTPTVGPRIPIISPTKPLLPTRTNTSTHTPPRPAQPWFFPQTITGVPIGDFLVGVIGTLFLGVIAFGGIAILGARCAERKSEVV
jgi:hypothetical protein